MAQITNFFLGANSGSGFQNLFSEIMDPETAFDIMILKGGPGVGKNTFMREIGRTMEQAGADVEYLWCSGDPDSLDGVVIPALRCAVCDGTSPHAVEPKYPAAVDRYVDLGRFYDLPAAKVQAGEVKRHTRDYQDAYGRAYRCLKAARQVELDTVAEVSRSFDRQRAARRFSGIMARELRGRGIRVMALCPFWTRTAFFARATVNGGESVVKKYVAMYEPEQLVQRAWRDAKRGKDVSQFGFVARFQTGLTKLLPHSLVMDVWMHQQKLK